MDGPKMFLGLQSCRQYQTADDHAQTLPPAHVHLAPVVCTAKARCFPDRAQKPHPDIE